ncbi:hypothetical protein ABZ154_22980 [Streptomyces sp. NPDC006261]|uniref:hypothetical protein n=1 Tax=Streptomyces sp. NPDC006261 TaxID=3156739 RepID=UPI0033B7789D
MTDDAGPYAIAFRHRPPPDTARRSRTPWRREYRYRSAVAGARPPAQDSSK